MVEKKLNLNQPILSVRRHSHNMDRKRTENTSFPVMYHYSPNLNSGDVRKPGAVPFQWEHIPGKPKQDAALTDDEIDSVSRTKSFVSSCSRSTLNDADSSRRFSPDVTNENKPSGGEAVKVKEMDKQEKIGFWYKPTFAKSCSHYKDEHECENLVTVCCLLPRSCIKTSVCTMNPVPVITRFAVFPCGTVGSGSSSADSLSETGTSQEADDHQVKDKFKTLQELLADEDRLVRRNRLGVPPPLPRSPSDSWLHLTLSSTNKPSNVPSFLVSHHTNYKS